MRLGYDLCILDLEMNQNCPVTGNSGTIIEIGAVKFLRDGGIHPNMFSELVNPNETLGKIHSRTPGVESITDLTGITQQMVDNADQFGNVMKRFKEWCHSESKNIVLCGWGGDPYWLREQFNKNGIPYPFRGKTFDIKSMMVIINTFYNKSIKGDGLSTMMRSWELNFQDELEVLNEDTGIKEVIKLQKHRAVADAYNTALLLQKAWTFNKEKGKIILKALKHIGIYDPKI